MTLVPHTVPKIPGSNVNDRHAHDQFHTHRFSFLTLFAAESDSSVAYRNSRKLASIKPLHRRTRTACFTSITFGTLKGIACMSPVKAMFARILHVQESQLCRERQECRDCPQDPIEQRRFRC